MPQILAFAATVLINTIGLAATDFLIKFAGVKLLSLLASKLFGPKANSFVGLSSLQVMTRSSLEFRKIVYGQAIVSGPIYYNNASGSDNEFLWYGIALVDGESEDLVSVLFDNDVIPKADIDWAAGTGASDGTGTGDVSTSKWVGDNSTNAVQIYYYLGDDDQPVSGDLNTAFADIGTNHRLRGVTHIVCQLLYNVDTESVWKDGFPNNIRAVIKGRKIYDPRLDSTQIIDASTSPVTLGSGSHRYATPSTWEWSENPSLCVADYLFNIMGTDPATSIDWPSVADAADDCEVSVAVPPSASPENTETRFTCNGSLSMGSTHQDNLDTILSSMDGKLSYAGGVWKVRASVWESSSVNIDADDLAGPVEVRGSAPKSERFNNVRGFFVDPSRNYETAEFPPISAAAYLARDNSVEIPYDLQLPMTNTATMAQRIAFRNLEQGDNQIVCKLHMNARGAKVVIGDIVSLTLDDLSWSSKTFRCIEWNRNPDSSFAVTLKEDDSADYVDPLVSEYGTAGSGDITTPSDVVPPPTNLTATSGPNSVVLNWSNIPSRLYSHIEIWASDDNERNNATIIATTPADTFTEVLVDNNRVRYYWIRAINFQDNFSNYEPNTSTTTATAAGYSTTPGVILDPDFDLSTASYSYWDVNEKEIGSVSRAADANLLIGSGANSSNAWELIPPFTDGTDVGSIVEIISKNRFRLNAGMVEVNIRFKTSSAIVGDDALSGFAIRFEGYDAHQGGNEQTESGLSGMSLDDTSGAWQMGRFAVPISDDDSAQFWRVSIGLSNYDVATDPVFIIDSIFIIPISGKLIRTAAEVSASVTPKRYEYEPGNVLRYGTNSTPGTTDMTTALQAALDSGHKVFIPDDTYITDELTVGSNTVIEFESHAAILKLATGASSGDNILTNTNHTGGNSNITIIGGKTDGNRVARAAVSTVALGDSNISMVKVTRLRIDGHYVTSATRHGITTEGNGTPSDSDDYLSGETSQDVVVTNCYATDCGDDGITFHHTDNIVCTNNICWNMAATLANNSNGIEFEDGCRDVICSNNVCYNTAEYDATAASSRVRSDAAGSFMRRGIDVSASDGLPSPQNIQLIDNSIRRVWKGIDARRDGDTSLGTPKNILISDNKISDCQSTPIRVISYIGYVIDGNIIEDEQSNALSTSDGILVTNDAGDGIISNNYVANLPTLSRGIAIRSGAGAGHQIISNYVKDAGASTSIYVQVADVTVALNRVSGDSGATGYGIGSLTNGIVTGNSSSGHTIPVSKNPGAGTIVEDNQFGNEAITGTANCSRGIRITELDSSSGAVTATLGDGKYDGHRKKITMSNASNSSTLSVTSHETSDPEVFTFAQTTDILILEWDSSNAVWWTVKNIGVTT